MSPLGRRSSRTPEGSRFSTVATARPGPGPGRSGESQQVVQAAIEARLRRHLADCEQHARNIRLAARRAVRDGQRLSWQAEDDLLVSDKAGQAHAVDGDSSLLPAARTGKRLLLGLAVRERPVFAT